MPVLCISGAADRALAPASVGFMAAKIGGRFVEIPHAGHMLALEVAPEVDMQLARFLA